MAAPIRPRARVLIVDDDPLIADLLTATLSDHGYVARSAGDGREALALIRAEPLEVVILDVHLPDVSGYHLCQAIREQHGDSVGIMLISGERKEAFDRAGGLLIGADDYLVKPFVLDEVLARVQRLARRARPLPRGVSAQLTRREHEVLRSLASGLDHHAIARDLVIAPKTVEKHIEHILFKLGVHSRAQAIALALSDESAGAPVVDLPLSAFRADH